MSLPNIVFLDMDGVLCTSRASVAMRNDGGQSYLDPVACHLVKRLCEDSSAKLVVSSAWRLHMDLATFQSLLNAVCPNLGNLIWCSQTWWRTTSAVFSNDVGYFCNRGAEIKHWIDEHSSKFNRFVILDDDADMEPLMESFVQTDIDDGFGFRDFLKAQKILRGSCLDE